jgi:uncharacterized protein CbrC (UPF0167 family)
MPKEPLPVFVYHPEPMETGSIVESDDVCLVCGRIRGYLYRGSVYGIRNSEIRDNICPWCIADGSAHELYGVEFCDSVGFDGTDDWKSVPKETRDFVRQRMPSFFAWQHEDWWTHCGDVAMFLGHAGTKELKERWPEVIPIIWQHIQQWNWDEDYKKVFMENLHAQWGPTVYVFQCRHCGKFGAYWDCH